MRRTMAILAVLCLTAACSDERGGDVVVDAFDTSVPSTTAPSTTAPPTTAPSTTVPSTTVPSTTVPGTTSLPPESGTCGDWIPVVTDNGTRCVDPNEVAGWQVESRWFDPASADATLPPVLVADTTFVGVWDAGQPDGEDYTFLFHAGGHVDEARMLADGSVIVQETTRNAGEDPWVSIVIYHPDGSVSFVPGARLFDTVTIDDRELAVVGGLDGVEGGLPIMTIDVETLETVHPFLGLWSTDAHDVTHVDVGVAQALVTGGDSAWRDLEGLPLAGRFSRTDDIEPNETLEITAGGLSPDAATAVWASHEPGEAWYLEARDATTGDLRLGWTIPSYGPPDAMVVDSTFHTGDFVIVNRGTTGDPSVQQPAFVIDLRGEEPDDWETNVLGHLYPIGGH